MTKAKIIGTGSYLPDKILSNHDLEKMVDTSDEWIVTRTGMKERRIAHENEHTSDMGFLAAKKAIEKAKVDVKDIDLIIVATSTPDYLFPGTGAIIQTKLGAYNAAAFDLSGVACTGYIYGLNIAKPLVEMGTYKNVLVIASEKLSTIVDYEDRNTCVLFGDGAAASVISLNGSGLEICCANVGTDGNQADLLKLPAGGCRQPATAESVQNKQHYIQMIGKEVFKHAVRRMESAAEDCINFLGLSKDDISWLISHQANERIIDVLAKRFEVPSEKVYKIIHKYGNTSASSVLIALDELDAEGKIVGDDHILLVAFGAGLTWGASVLKKV